MRNRRRSAGRVRGLTVLAVSAALALLGAGVAAAKAPSAADTLLALLFPGGVPDDREAAAEQALVLTEYAVGKRLFFEETFGGNGRTCATCHDPRNEFTISPALVEGRFARDPDHPLFRAIDSDDGDGASYENLRRLGVVRVTLTLHENVRVDGAPFDRTIEVWRGVPSISNVALTAPFLSDGRAATLPDQAAGAIRDHMEPAREPLAEELKALETFMEETYYPLRLETLPDINDPVLVEPGFTVPLESPVAIAGRQIFMNQCASCHGGELGHLPLDPHIPRVSSVFVSEANRNGFPLHRLVFRRPDGTELLVETPDPGRAAITGRLSDLNAFETTPLRGLKHTAPYFHDNSAATLGEMIDHYNEFFPEMALTGRRKNQLLAYLETL